jgi:hypothetical protein
MRRSERVTKKPEFLTFTDNRRRKSKDDDLEEIDSQSEVSVASSPITAQQRRTAPNRDGKTLNREIASDSKTPSNLFGISQR